jgi:hypothetical protein
MDPTTKMYVKMMLTDFIKYKIHKKGELLDEESSENFTSGFLTDIIEAKLINTEEEITAAKEFTENIISKHQMIQRQFGIEFLKKESTHIVIIE